LTTPIWSEPFPPRFGCQSLEIDDTKFASQHSPLLNYAGRARLLLSQSREALTSLEIAQIVMTPKRLAPLDAAIARGVNLTDSAASCAHPLSPDVAIAVRAAVLAT
jgi:hypothetical protein